MTTNGKISSLFFTIVFCFASALNSEAQILFFEDFENGIDSTFTLRDIDGRTPASNVAYVNKAWVTRSNFDNTSDTVAVSTSWYDPAGASDDWLITPLIHIDSQTVLSWDAKAQDADFPDGYQVRISTTDTSLASFNSNFALFNTNGENPTWTTRTVNLADEGYSNQDVYLAFRNVSNDMFLLLIDDIMVRNPFTTDVKAVSLEVPAAGCQLGNAEQISITVENFGGTTLTSFDATYVISDSINPPVTVTETVSTNIAPGSTYTYTFTQGADFSAPGTVYTVNAYVYASADGDFTNDTLAQDFVLNVAPFDVDTTYSSSFETVGEILGWTNEDVNNDTTSWFLASGDAHTGNVFYAYQYNQDATTPGNDWLFSTCLNFDTAKQYELKFFHKVGNSQGTVFNEKLKVAIGTSPDASSMTTVLEDLGELANDFYQEQRILFTVPAAGTYFIGFHCYSDPDAFALSIDDVSVGEKQPPVAGFITSTSELQVVFSSTSVDADSLYWNFDDGSNASGTPVIHNFTAAGTYNVCVTAFNAAGQDTYCDSVSVTTDSVSGVALIDNAQFSVFPNPSQGVFIAQMNSKVIGKSTLIVSDIVGKRLIALPVEYERISFDLAGQAEGVYFITLQAGDTQLRRKIILTR